MQEDNDNKGGSTEKSEEKKMANYLTLDEKIFTYQGSRSEFEANIRQKITEIGLEIIYARHSCTEELTKGFIRLKYEKNQDVTQYSGRSIDTILGESEDLKEYLADKRLVLEDSVKKHAY
jgi:hypothetical protein